MDSKSKTSPGLVKDYQELEIIFDFFTDNPQKVMPGDVNSPKRDNPYYDPYWEAIRAMQESGNFLEGILLRSVDCKPRFPYVHYIVYRNEAGIKSSSLLPAAAAQTMMMTTMMKKMMSHPPHDSTNNGRVANGLDKEFIEILKSRGGYRELHTFVDRRTPLLPKRPSNPNTAYIVSAFMTSGNLDNLDKTWSYWSGADYIVENIPASLKLERLTFHKIINSSAGSGAQSASAQQVSSAAAAGASSSSSADGNGFSYVLLCELGEALADINRAREFIDHLKFRQCGVSSLYVIDHFF